MDLQQASKRMLRQLIYFIDQIELEQFSAHLSILSGNTIGKHLRHIIEFYQHLLMSYTDEQIVVDYDARQRNHQTETDKEYAKSQLEILINHLEKANTNREMLLCFCLTEQGERQHISTTFYRELAYNLEHTVHHLAILKMAVITHFPEIPLSYSFGVAYATMQNQNTQGT
ncbi:MAG: hypothetical protein EAZ08_05355 [Cytophagales bacterium]|nr:MAG: hypothetical protein EAZ08_05355 [Cytophagales bacterium]